jgi:hypothetical protein
VAKPTWYHELEDRLVPLVFEAACKASPNVSHVELRLENGSIKAVVNQRPTPEERKKVANTIKRKLRGQVADTKKLRIQVTRGFKMMYTMHLKARTQAPRVFPSLQNVTVFKVTASELLGLRTIYNGLVRKSAANNFVATTALGGVPGLLHIIETVEDRERPEDINEWGPFYEQMRSRFHLFPGLLWSNTPTEADQLFAWLRSLPPGCSVLLFDTGTDGNGVRRMSNCIRERVSVDEAFGPAQIKIIGVVDGRNDRQAKERSKLRHASGHIELTVNYHHVPKVLTEDCQQLLGYDSIRRELMYKSLRSNAVIELVSDDGQHIQTVGAMSGASILRRLVRHHPIGQPTGSEYAGDVNRFLTGMILHASLKSEWQMLRNAVEYGLIDVDAANKEAVGAEKRARAVFEKSAFANWNFKKNKSQQTRK